jgi:hypothetical protein
MRAEQKPRFDLVVRPLESLGGESDPNEDAKEFERLSSASQGDSHGWKFDREELHERA